MAMNDSTQKGKRKILILGYNIENSSFHKKLRLLIYIFTAREDANLLLKSDYDAFIVYGYRKIIPKSILISEHL